MMSRIRIALGVVALAGLTACEESLLPEAQYAVSVDTMSLYAFNSAPRTAPSALSVSSTNAVPISSTFAFDVAFDIDAQGRAVIYPVQLLASGVPGRAGIRVMSPATFESIQKAPTSGFRYDSATVVGQGAVVVVQTSTDFCPYWSPLLYAKIAVDSILPAEGRVKVRFSANPNCGYLSLSPGRPKE